VNPTVLHVTNMYPVAKAPMAGVFVRDAIDAMRFLRPTWCHQVFNLRPNAASWGRNEDHPVLRLAAVGREYGGQTWRLSSRGGRRPDVLHAHYVHSVLAATVARRHRLVCSFYGTDVNMPRWRWLARFSARHADHVIVMSRRMQELLGLSENRVSVIPVGIDIRRYGGIDARQARAENGIKPGQPVILFPGHPSRVVKNYPLFRETLDELRRQGLGLQEIQLRDVPPPQVPRMLAVADVILLTSLSEGAPRIIREALAAGVRVVSVDVGDVSDLCGNRRGCRVVTTRNKLLLAEAVREVLGEPAPRLGREELVALDIRTTAHQILQVYDAILS
jgi:glycosyltransferase involved in cell wall biosynthesis